MVLGFYVEPLKVPLDRQLKNPSRCNLFSPECSCYVLVIPQNIPFLMGKHIVKRVPHRTFSNYPRPTIEETIVLVWNLF